MKHVNRKTMMVFVKEMHTLSTVGRKGVVENMNRCFEDSHFPNSLWYWSISIIAVQFNGTRCLLQSNVLINRRYLSLASLLLPMTVAMTLSQ